MLENSKDLLYIVLSFSVLWVTVFLCWLIYYLVSILRNANEMVEELRERFRGIEDAIRSIRDKMEHATSTLSFVSEGVMRLIQYFISRGKGITETVEKKKKK
jgi:predicted PurR-regulated permease PerM